MLHCNYINESETRAEYINLRLKESGWGKTEDSRVLCEYGRVPTLDEWKYWAKRYSTDKRDWEKMRGAMWWWKTRGSTPVDPRPGPG